MSKMLKRPSANTPMFRAADFILAIVLIAAGFLMSFFLSFGNSDGAQLTATADGKLYGTYSLAEDQTITIRHNGHTNRFEITAGKVRMISADCRGHDCIKEGSISKAGETIVCLPNRVVLEISGEKEGFDAISQ